MVGCSVVAALRLIQGFGLGAGAGDTIGPLVFLAEHAPEFPALHASLAPMSAAVGTLAAALTCLFFSAILSPEELADWGWRLPIVCSLMFSGVAAAVRLFDAVRDPQKFMSEGELADRHGQHLGKVMR